MRIDEFNKQLTEIVVKSFPSPKHKGKNTRTAKCQVFKSASWYTNACQASKNYCSEQQAKLKKSRKKCRDDARPSQLQYYILFVCVRDALVEIGDTLIKSVFALNCLIQNVNSL